MQLPEAFINSLQNIKGFDEKLFREAHQSGEQVTSVRLNAAKIHSSPHAIFTQQLQKIPWSSNGYYLSSRPSFTLDPLLHAGAYYVQEASSMFLEEALRQSLDLLKPLRVLDLCAAPGGKSTLIQSLISSESLLVSNEVIKTRVNILSENITKWGACNVVVTNNDPRDFQRLPGYFDVILIDAPCSGSGLFRKDPDAINEWSLNNVALCSQRQQRIFSDVLPSLKPGGILVYSTCSYSADEDEEICDWLLSGNNYLSGVRLSLETEWNIVETRSSKNNTYGYRFYPYKLKGEGFFLAVFKREESRLIPEEAKNIKSRYKPFLQDKKVTEILSPWLSNPGSFSFIEWQKQYLAIPSPLLNDVLKLQSLLYIKKAGVRTGEIIRNELIPSHELALSNLLAKNIAFIDADLETALQYLRRNEFKTDSILKGWVLIKYKNIALGWIKILPGRINNYYPKEWRILNK